MGDDGLNGWLDAFDAESGKHLALERYPKARRARVGNMVRRFVEDRRRRHVADRQLRSES
jgi:hypothetical protein